MEQDFLFNLKEMSWEVVVIAVVVFGLTMLIKWPIKKVTSRLEENKRKAVNTVIVFIPMILSLLLNVLFFGLFKAKWFAAEVFEAAFSSYLLAVGLYAVYSRIIILIKGVKKQTENQDFSKEAVAYIKKNITTISKTLKVDEKKMDDVVSEIEKLLKLREEITKNVTLQDISATENLNNQIKCLENQKAELESSIAKSQAELEVCQKSINK